jgi:hypothetical protein
MGTQAAGQAMAKVIRPPYAAPWSTVRTYRGQAAPSSSGHTISPHAGRRPLCMYQGLSCSGSPPRVMPSSFTAAALLPSRLLLHLHTPAWRAITSTPSSHPAGCMHMPPTVCPLLEPTDRHAGHIYRHGALLYSFMRILFVMLIPV